MRQIGRIFLKNLNKVLHLTASGRNSTCGACTSSSAVEQPVYTGSVGGSIPSSCTILFHALGCAMKVLIVELSAEFFHNN